MRSRESPKDMVWKHTAYHVNKSDIGHTCLKQEQKKKKNTNTFCQYVPIRDGEGKQTQTQK